VWTGRVTQGETSSVRAFKHGITYKKRRRRGREKGADLYEDCARDDGGPLRKAAEAIPVQLPPGDSHCQSQGGEHANDNIKRTIVKAMGAGGGDNYESVVYEGYGPGWRCRAG
jgi:hypothetical protein